MTIDFGGESILLLPERAFFWKPQSLIGFSDVHFGKAQSLQRAGLPVSKAAHDEDLAQITRLIELYQPRDIVILGDFIHQKDSWSDELVDELKSFLGHFPDTRFNLILGNHDRGSEKYLFRLPFHLFENEMTRGRLTLAHGHRESENEFRIEGHVHPACVMREGSTRLRLPCFAVTENRLLLPSFGTLTGGYEIEAQKDTRIYAVIPNQVFEVKGKG